MNDEIKKLIESLRCGNYEDPKEKISLLAAALREHQASVSLLISLLTAPQAPLRLAALEAATERSEFPVQEAVARLAQDRDARVRVKTAQVLGFYPDAVAAEALSRLGKDSEDEVRIAAVKATSAKPAHLELQKSLLAADAAWEVRLAAAKSLANQENATAAQHLFRALADDPDEDVRRQCAEAVEKFLTDSEASAQQLPTDIGMLNKVERRLQPGGGRFSKLAEWLRSHTTVAIDPQTLAKFGTNLTESAKNGLLPHAYGTSPLCETIAKLLRREPCRSLVLLGESGVGKSALVQELAHTLAKPENGGWIVLRVSPTDFMVGTKYTGEWETRVVELVNAVSRPRRVLVYVPNLPDLAAMGRWSKSDANVATALSPYLEEGKIVVLGETTPAEFERGFGSLPSVQRLFDKLLIAEANVEETLEVLRGIRGETGMVMADGDLARLQEMSDYFLGHLRRPGNAATLLRAVIGNRAKESPITFPDVLTALSQSSGVPPQLLDDRVPLEEEEIRTFFEQRIMGQPEAVSAVVDLVTLIKAGLTDPNKPFGVELFVGPTGVGKTELARALAEYIFGDAKRLLRFDMSEYATPDGFQRLIGGRGENGLLTDPVRQQPFSVVLLDEIEKSHVNIFDMCLQIFDAGRLTDGRGRLIDFRRTIVILTSNIGAQGPATPLGFGASPDTEASFKQEKTWRELSRFFRPEFLNRIDRVVQFNPLSLETAERIARREIDLVLQRSGVTRRGLTVHVDPSVTALLVREGYSPHFGARPLKRTVEQQLLVPLARSIASSRTNQDRLMTVTTENGKIVLRATKKAAAPEPAATTDAPAGRRADTARLAGLKDRLAALEERLVTLRDRKSELVAKTSEPGFYQNESVRAATFDEIRKLDQFFDLAGTLQRALEGLERRLASGPRTAADEASLCERLDDWELDVAHAETIASARNTNDLADTVVVLTLINREGKPIGGVPQLAEVFRQFALRHRLATEFLAEHFADAADQVCLCVSGLGAHLLFKPEAGMHKLERRSRPASPRNGREKTVEDSELIRVEVIPVTAEPDKKFAAAVTAAVRERRPAQSRLVEKACWQVRLFHAPSVRSLETCAAGSRAEALARAMQILHAQVTAGGKPATEIIRHYALGIGSRIRDNRTGRSTSRLGQFFKGHLELMRAAEKNAPAS